jgi:serine/threonine-protein kinase
MAPEQWRREPPTPALDVYAATCVFYECLTGQGPHPSGDPDGTSAIPAAEIAEPLRPLISAGLAKDPADRPVGAAAFVSLLEEAATSAYGADWELQGIAGLSAAAATLAVLFPLTSLGLSSGASATGASASGSTSLGPSPARTGDAHTLRTGGRVSRRAASLSGKAGAVKTAVAVTAAVGLTAGAAGTVVYARHHAGGRPAAVASPLASPSAAGIRVTTSYIGDPLTSTYSGFHIDQVRISGSPRDAEINAEIAAFANKIADLNDTGGQITALPSGYQNDIVTAKVRRAGPKLLSIAYRISHAGIGSADGGGVDCGAEDIDVSTGAELGSRDLVATISGLAPVIQRSGAAVDDFGSPLPLSADQATTIANNLGYSSIQRAWNDCVAFTKDSLEVTAPSGDLAAVYQGAVTVRVPLAAIRRFLRPIALD